MSPHGPTTPLASALCALLTLPGLPLLAGATTPHSLEVDPNGPDLVWMTSTGQQYALLASTNLTHWHTADGFPQDGTGAEARAPLPQSETSQYFRVNQLGAQQHFLPLPADGTRMDSYEEFDGPRWPDTYGHGHITLWHNGKFAAYSITIDDNNSPDFPFWLDVSTNYNWKLTWFVIVHPYVWDIYNDVPGNNTGYFGTLAEWQELQNLGHDIQLHGACAAMNDLTATEYEDHIVRSINVLESQTGTDVLTFAYPCGAITSGDGQHDYKAIISQYTISARGGTGGGVTPVHLLDYHTTKSLGVNTLVNGEPGTLFGRYDDMRNFLFSQYRGWCVTLYHGVSDAAETNVIETLDWVKAHEDEFWVAPYTDVAKYAQQRESAQLDILTVAPDRIVFRVSDGMDDALFDHPLTVKLRLDPSWTTIHATQNGNPIAASLVTHEGDPYGYIQPIPDRGEVVVTP